MNRRVCAFRFRIPLGILDTFRKGPGDSSHTVRVRQQCATQDVGAEMGQRERPGADSAADSWARAGRSKTKSHRGRPSKAVGAALWRAKLGAAADVRVSGGGAPRRRRDDVLMSRAE